jgi:hypothetical protein
VRDIEADGADESVLSPRGACSCLPGSRLNMLHMIDGTIAGQNGEPCHPMATRHNISHDHALRHVSQYFISKSYFATFTAVFPNQCGGVGAGTLTCRDVRRIWPADERIQRGPRRRN